MRKPPTTTVRSTRGFTLIELLVVVSIIALLIGILIPVLGIARTKAQDTVCQTNQRNLMQGWHSYIADKRRFPNYEGADKPFHQPPYANAWGGATPKVRNYAGAQVQMSVKPLNEYLGLNDRTRVRMEAFRCPRDNGARDQGVNTTLRESDGLTTTYLDDTGSDDSMFFLRGNSYYANDWVWAPVGAIDGAGPRSNRRWNHFNVPDQVLAYPSDTMGIADGGAAYAISMSPTQRTTMLISMGWWHGEDRANMAMWDGSVKFVQTHVGGAGPEFNRWLIPERHRPEGTPIAFFNGLRNPQLASPGAPAP